ncbi:MAG: tRNA (adenosine(37)-N6)-threonylcarbamoyltransferase complex dimerization subunit type 1 TsaB [Candidatus Limnocylindrales bacterium]
MLIALDTATRQATIALGEATGRWVAGRDWEAGHGHSGSLLPNLEALLESVGTGLGEVTGVVVGTGPGSFTGLRVGLATGKILAYGLRCPIVGVPTMEALALAALGGECEAQERLTVLLPAGPTDRYSASVAVGPGARALALGLVRLEPATEAERIGNGTAAAGRLLAVDLRDAAEPEAADLGRHALAGLGGALLALGGERLARGDSDDLAVLVPAYVTLPRGVSDAAASIQWSPDLR